MVVGRLGVVVGGRGFVAISIYYLGLLAFGGCWSFGCGGGFVAIDFHITLPLSCHCCCGCCMLMFCGGEKNIGLSMILL